MPGAAKRGTAGSRRQTRARWGEALAALCLRLKGYRIEARNWRCGLGELDLVSDGDVVCRGETRACARRGPKMQSAGASSAAGPAAEAYLSSRAQRRDRALRRGRGGAGRPGPAVRHLGAFAPIWPLRRSGLQARLEGGSQGVSLPAGVDTSAGGWIVPPGMPGC
jgi:Holliday junction resolvase-like predicted endonuclease